MAVNASTSALREWAVTGGWLEPKYHNLPFIVHWWEQMLTHFTADQLMSWVFWVLIVITYIVGGGLFTLADYMGWFRNYKIQYDRLPTSAQYSQALKNLLFNYLCIIFPLSFGNLYILEWIGSRPEMTGFPSFWTMAWQITFFFLIEDVFQYFLHRWLHTPWAYKHIHKVHHHFVSPFGLSGAYAHWAEVLILAIPTYSGPLFVGPHLATMYLWIIIRELDTTHTHCGYEFPVQRWINAILPFYGGTPFHDYHHYAFDVNFASRLTFLDKMFNTYEELPPHTFGDLADSNSGWHRSVKSRLSAAVESGAAEHGSSVSLVKPTKTKTTASKVKKSPSPAVRRTKAT